MSMPEEIADKIADWDEKMKGYKQDESLARQAQTQIDNEKLKLATQLRAWANQIDPPRTHRGVAAA